MTNELNEKLEKLQTSARLGGGEAQIEKQHAKGKFTARERLKNYSIRGPLLKPVCMLLTGQRVWEWNLLIRQPMG